MPPTLRSNYLGCLYLPEASSIISYLQAPSLARIQDLLKGGTPLGQDIARVTSSAPQEIDKHPPWTFTSSTPPPGHCPRDVIPPPPPKKVKQAPPPWTSTIPRLECPRGGWPVLSCTLCIGPGQVQGGGGGGDRPWIHHCIHRMSFLWEDTHTHKHPQINTHKPYMVQKNLTL